ncbi:hypothetical protein ACJ8NE_001057 [Klebsiella pneumoniae]
MRIDINKIVPQVFLAFILVKAFSGPIGIIFQPLNYVPTLMMLILMLRRWAIDVMTKPVSLALVTLVILYFIIGIGNFSTLQASFGLYIMIPFFYCLTYSKTIAYYVFNGTQKLYFFLFITCCIGIAYVSMFGAPWLGGIINVGGVDKVISRDWTTGGVLRNPGFTAASFDAATLLMISSFFIISKFFEDKKFVLAFLIFLTSIYFIYLTTTKTTIVTLIIALVLMLTPVFLTKIMVKIIIIVSILFSYFYMIPQLKYETYDPQNTLLMRMYSTWPRAISLLDDSISIFVGKGFGAIGTPAQYFSPKFYSPGDNVLVYMYVICGFVSVILVGLFVFKFLFSRFYDASLAKKYYIICFCIMVGGVTYNLFESVFYSTSLGVLIGFLFDKNACKLSFNFNHKIIR